MSKLASFTSTDSHIAIDSWIAFDLQWESVTSELPETEAYNRITTFSYYGNKMAIDIDDFASCQNPSLEYSLAINNIL
ncbi:MAG: hypothetical protein M3044_20045 [Thermoproteota archaeon]|nr:hypothetical protein [Thermoproteota archaeon]